MGFVKALLIAGGVVAAMYYGPKVIRLIMMRWGFIIDALIGISIISVLAPAGAAAAAFGTMMALSLTLIMMFVRYFNEHEVEAAWTKKDYLKGILILAAISWLPMIEYPTLGFIIYLFVLSFAVFGLRPKSKEHIDRIEHDREILYVRTSAWKSLLKRRRARQ